MSVVVFYVSGHGFGHAARDIEVIRALVGRSPDLRIVVRTAVPAWFFESAPRRRPGTGAVPSIEVQAAETDTGVVQVDSLRIDEHATARRASDFHRTFRNRAAAEAAVLRTLAADVVIGDVPPLAFAAAHLAGVPSVLVANFTWDWIYRAFPGFDAAAPGVMADVLDSYACATLALRLPLHGPLAPVAGVVRDIPLIARTSALGRDESRRRLHLEDHLPVVLASFGRYGMPLPYEATARDNRLTLLVTDHEAGSTAPQTTSRFRCFSRRDMQGLGIEYQDLVSAADVVVSKPGYGIVSECIANGTALLYPPRGRFPEYDVFVREMPDVLRCRPIAQEDLQAGRWSDGVDALLRQPAPPRTLAVDGAEIAAHTIATLLAGSGAYS